MKAARILTLILGVMMIVTGVYCLFTPAMTYLTLGYIVGFNMMMDAIGGIATWSDRRRLGIADGWTLAGSIASLAFSVILLGSAAMQLAVDLMIVYIAAMWLVVSGIIRIIRGVQLRKLQKALQTQAIGSRWWLVLLTGILLVAFGVLSFSDPSGLMVAIGINFGINIIVSGVGLVAVAA